MQIHTRKNQSPMSPSHLPRVLGAFMVLLALTALGVAYRPSAKLVSPPGHANEQLSADVALDKAVTDAKDDLDLDAAERVMDGHEDNDENEHDEHDDHDDLDLDAAGHMDGDVEDEHDRGDEDHAEEKTAKPAARVVSSQKVEAVERVVSSQKVESAARVAAPHVAEEHASL